MITVLRNSAEAALLTDGLRLISSRDADFTILWNSILREGIFVMGPPTDAIKFASVGVSGDGFNFVKPSANTIGVVEDYLNAQGYELERK